jgi:hypothetical protein
MGQNADYELLAASARASIAGRRTANYVMRTCRLDEGGDLGELRAAGLFGPAVAGGWTVRSSPGADRVRAYWFYTFSALVASVLVAAGLWFSFPAVAVILAGSGSGPLRWARRGRG